MIKKYAKSALSVQETINKFGFKSTVLELRSSTRTAADAASSINCDIAQIVKSLIFITSETKKPVLVLVSGLNQVDEKKIENQLGEAIIKADVNFVKEVTGFAIGGVPPFGYKNPINLVYIDDELIKLNDVWAAAGTPNAVFCIKSSDLLSATNGKVISLAK